MIVKKPKKNYKKNLGFSNKKLSFKFLKKKLYLKFLICAFLVFSKKTKYFFSWLGENTEIKNLHGDCYEEKLKKEPLMRMWVINSNIIILIMYNFSKSENLNFK